MVQILEGANAQDLQKFIETYLFLSIVQIALYFYVSIFICINISHFFNF